MALGDTFDLARAYGAAESIKNSQANRQYQSDIIGLRKRELEDEQTSAAELKHLQEKYVMYQAAQDNPALKKQIIGEFRANAPQDHPLAQENDETIWNYLGKGFEVKLKLTPEKGDKPEKAHRTISRNGRKVEQEGYFDPKTRTYTWTDTAEGYEKPDKGSGDGEGDKEIKSTIPSAISNSIARASADLLGGIVKMGPDGEIQIQVLDPSLRPQIVDLRAQAERIWIESGGKISPGEAVQRASKDPGTRPQGRRGGATPAVEGQPTAAPAAAPAPAKPAAPPPSPSSPNSAPQQSASSTPQQRAYNPQTGEWAVLINGQWVIQK